VLLPPRPRRRRAVRRAPPPPGQGPSAGFLLPDRSSPSSSPNRQHPRPEPRRVRCSESSGTNTVKGEESDHNGVQANPNARGERDSPWQGRWSVRSPAGLIPCAPPAPWQGPHRDLAVVLPPRRVVRRAPPPPGQGPPAGGRAGLLLPELSSPSARQAAVSPSPHPSSRRARPWLASSSCFPLDSGARWREWLGWEEGRGRRGCSGLRGFIGGEGGPGLAVGFVEKPRGVTVLPCH
jgi:hypothetical protein